MYVTKTRGHIQNILFGGPCVKASYTFGMLLGFMVTYKKNQAKNEKYGKIFGTVKQKSI